MDELPRPRAGFFGNLRARSVDFDLIAAVARCCVEKSFSLTGQEPNALHPVRGPFGVFE